MEIEWSNEMSTTVFEASDEVVNEAAASSARLLEKWFGGVDEAIAALEADKVDLADLAMRGHIKQRKEMTVATLHEHSRI